MKNSVEIIHFIIRRLAFYLYLVAANVGNIKEFVIGMGRWPEFDKYFELVIMVNGVLGFFSGGYLSFEFMMSSFGEIN